LGGQSPGQGAKTDPGALYPAGEADQGAERDAFPIVLDAINAQEVAAKRG